MVFLMYFLIIAAIALPIPAAILIGQRWRSGAMVASALGVLIALLPIWIISVMNLPSAWPYWELFSYVAIFLVAGGVLLFVSAWAVALERAFSQRHWWGFLLVLVGGLVSDGLFFLVNPLFYYPCPSGSSGLSCFSDPQLTHTIFLAAILIGPAAILAYAWLPSHAPAPASPVSPSTSLLNTPGGEQ